MEPLLDSQAEGATGEAFEKWKPAPDVVQLLPPPGGKQTKCHSTARSTAGFPGPATNTLLVTSWQQIFLSLKEFLEVLQYPQTLKYTSHVHLLIWA